MKKNELSAMHDFLTNSHDRDRFPLTLLNKKGTKGCILKNCLCPPYKKPRLPLGGKSAKVHSLLRPLKIAHAWMVKELLSLGENLPDEYCIGRVLYGIDRMYEPRTNPFYIGMSYLQGSVDKPFLAHGFEIEWTAVECFDLSFDLTPFHPDSEYSDNSGYSQMIEQGINTSPLAAAAAFYNECVESLFNEGFLIFPTFYTDALAEICPVETISPKAIIVEI